VAVVTALAPVPVVISVAVPSVVEPFENVMVPVGGADAPATVGIVKVSTTGEPKLELVGLAVRVSVELAMPTVSVVEDEIALKLPAAGAVAVMVSVPTGKAVVVVVATQEVAEPVKAAVPRVTPPLTKVTVEVGQTPLTGAIVSVSVTVIPYVSPVAGVADSVPVELTALTVSVVVAVPEA
jgi:hypothetical protein